jgi:hypothetical protein
VPGVDRIAGSIVLAQLMELPDGLWHAWREQVVISNGR